jgi:pimeloyl-ACP methyl ester carboxylesterase
MVKSIYLDAPLLNFEAFGKNDPERIGPWAKSIPEKGWRSDPRMPVNMADSVAKAGIPILLLYGGKDQVVPPASNCELFFSRFKASGGDIKVIKRDSYTHHPHGVELDDLEIVLFFMKK